jgi:anaerobic magnesium-protoporphyrin IX monomethyl ester cyclase
VSGKRVLIAQSYFLRFDPKLFRTARPVPPLGALICASVLRERSFDVRFFDSMLADSEDQCAAAMDREKPDVLVIFEDNFNYLTKMCLERMREAAVRMTGMARERGIDVVVAGSDASDDPGFFLKAGASAVAFGEGEYSVAEWLERGAGSTPGIAVLGSDGAVFKGPTRPPVRDVDSIPSPAWDLIDAAAYRRVWMTRSRDFSLPLASSRGCPFHCNWCAKPIWGQRYNAMSPARAAREVATLKKLGATRVNVLDDIFGLKPDWLEEFDRELERLDARLPFKCLSRADLLTERAVHALAKAGCDLVWIGAESGSQKILDAMEKGTTVDEIRAATHRLKAANIRVAFFLQFGYPGETHEDVEATFRLLDELLPDDIGISVSYPLPGTRFHARVKNEMGRGTHWRDSSDLAMLFDNPLGTTYYRRLHAYTHARFQLARALRSPRGGVPRRLVRAAWFSAKRVVMRVGLEAAARHRTVVRDLPPEMNRAQAATPDVHGPSDSSEGR